MNIKLSYQEDEYNDNHQTSTTLDTDATHHDADFAHSTPHESREVLHLPAKRKKGKSKALKREIGDS
jgi:hypothetical protein